MPIRHCQKCSLKVLIDESQAGTAIFYCQRCTTALKGPEKEIEAPVVKRPAPAPVLGQATVRVLCPYCKASFNGRVPLKPARGSCPVCQKDLILLPNGEIKPSTGFDANQWRKESGPSSAPVSPPIEKQDDKRQVTIGPDTHVLIRSFSADPPITVAEDPPDQVSEPAPAQEPAPLPGYLDPPDEAPIPESVPDLPEDLPPPPPRMRPTTVPPSPLSRPGAPRLADRQIVRDSEAVTFSTTGPVKIFLALFLVALPLLSCPILLSLRPKLKASPFEKLGTRFSKGLIALHQWINPPPPKPPKVKAPAATPKPEPPPKPEPGEQKLMEDSISSLLGEIRRLERDIRSNAVGATPEQIASLQQVRLTLDEKKKRYADKRELYKKMYARDYDPEKQ